MANVYDSHDKHFERVGAWAVTFEGNVVAKIKIKFPKDGAGRLYAYVHWIGLPMVQGSATGYGYDKKTAAVSSAAHKMKKLHATIACLSYGERYQAFVTACQLDGGSNFDGALYAAGFGVTCVV